MTFGLNGRPGSVTNEIAVFSQLVSQREYVREFLKRFTFQITDSQGTKHLNCTCRIQSFSKNSTVLKAHSRQPPDHLFHAASANAPRTSATRRPSARHDDAAPNAAWLGTEPNQCRNPHPESGLVPKVIGPSQGRSINAFGIPMNITLRAEDTGGSLAALVAEFEPSQGPPPHFHHDHEGRISSCWKATSN